MRCEHNRDDYRTCPHCIGIGTASIGPAPSVGVDPGIRYNMSADGRLVPNAHDNNGNPITYSVTTGAAPQSWEEQRDAAWSARAMLKYDPVSLDEIGEAEFKAGADFGLAYARAEIERLERENAELARKCGELCNAYGVQGIKAHDVTTERDSYREKAEKMADLLMSLNVQAIVNGLSGQRIVTHKINEALADFERMKGRRSE